MCDLGMTPGPHPAQWRERHSGRLAIDRPETHLGAEGGSPRQLSPQHTRLSEAGWGFSMPEDKEGRGEAELGHALLVLKWRLLTS